jgi:hypothetical protein
VSGVVVFDWLTYYELNAGVFGSSNWLATLFKGFTANRAGAGGITALSFVEGAPKNSTPTSLGVIAGSLAV